jgi:hypothetical protein
LEVYLKLTFLVPALYQKKMHIYACIDNTGVCVRVKKLRFFFLNFMLSKKLMVRLKGIFIRRNPDLYKRLKS